MSSIHVNTINDTSGGNTVTINGYTPTLSNMAGRNRIINGDMRIDQRNNGAAITVNSNAGGQFPVDRVNCSGTFAAGVFTAQRSTLAPAGFANSLLCTVTTSSTSPASGDEYVVRQSIEGFNIADLGWGTASAQSITVSFWVRSSVTGTFAGSVTNGGFNRSYVFTYSVAQANTYEYKTVVIPGDTSGTWAGDNTAGIRLQFNLGAGSSKTGTAGVWSNGYLQSATDSVNLISRNGATFYITGVQLEAGSVATPFERRDYGRELMMCQRYFQTYQQPPLRGIVLNATQTFRMGMVLPVSMRAAPTATVGALLIYDASVTATVSSIVTSYLKQTAAEFDFNTTGASLTTGRPAIVYQDGTSTMTLSAEL